MNRRNFPVLGFWVVLGVLACTVLPWFAQTSAESGLAATGGVLGLAAHTSGLARSLQHGHGGPAIALAALLVAGLAVFCARGPRQGRWLAAAGALGVIGLLADGFLGAVAVRSFPGLSSLPGADRADGFGWGATLALLVLAVLGATGLARMGRFRGDAFVASVVVLCSGLLLLFVAWPLATALGQAFYDEAGRLSLASLWARATGERVWGLGCLVGGTRCGVAWNTLALALLTAASTTVLGTLMALLAERGGRSSLRVLNGLALLPIITPPFVVGLGLILLFGRAGLVNQALEAVLGLAPGRWFYGLPGIWLAQTFAFTPIAFMIMRGVVQGIPPSLEEAARTLRATRPQTLATVTLPLLGPGLANAFLVGFVESIADFGNPIVVGGAYAVLSTDIYFAIVGAQADQSHAASLAWVLTLFALAVFAAQRGLLGRRRFTTVSGKGQTGAPMALPPGLQRACRAVVWPWVGFTLVVYGIAVAGGFVQTWGRDFTPTLAHFRVAFSVEWGFGGWAWTGVAWHSLFTTLGLAAASAVPTAVVGLLMAWILARTDFQGRSLFEFAALLAFAIPGTVLGVSYILAFNLPPFELTGSALIIVLCFMFRNLPLGVRAGTAAFGQIDRSLDEASLMLRASSLQTLWHVVLPLIRPALAAALVYSFVRSITTVSAVIFLVTAEHELATTYIIGRVGNGDYGVALAYCTVLIALMGGATALIRWAVGERRLGSQRAVPGVAIAVSHQG